MSNFLKESNIQIEEELYELLNIKKENFENPDFISIISNDFFSFQIKLLHLIKNEFIISFDKSNYNDILKIHYNKQNQPKLRLRYNTYHEKEHNKAYVVWSNGIPDEITSIMPTSIDYMIIHDYDDYYTTQKIKKYFFEHLELLNQHYFDDIKELKSFLVPFDLILKKLKSINYDIGSIIPENKIQSNLSLFEILKNNKEINDIICLSTDFDIKESLNLINIYNKNIKLNNKLK